MKHYKELPGKYNKMIADTYDPATGEHSAWSKPTHSEGYVYYVYNPSYSGERPLVYRFTEELHEKLMREATKIGYGMGIDEKNGGLCKSLMEVWEIEPYIECDPKV